MPEPSIKTTVGGSYRIPSWWYMALVFIAGLGMMVAYQAMEQPLIGDRNYLMYISQAMMRNEPIYRTTDIGYPPLAALIDAVAAAPGRWLGLPGYLAVRLVSIPAFVLLGVLLYQVTTDVTGQRRVGLWAGLLYFSIKPMLVIGSVHLEPKLLVQFCALVLVFALHRRRWLLAGIAVGAATTSWFQGAAMGLAPLVIGLYTWRRTGWQGCWRFILGLILGVLPAALYLTITGQWLDYLTLGFYLKFLAVPDIASATSASGIVTMIVDNMDRSTLILIPLSLLGITDYVYRSRWRSDDSTSQWAVLLPESGGVLWLTVACLLYSAIAEVFKLELVGKADLLAYHYLLAFWSALGLWAGWQLLSHFVSSPVVHRIAPNLITGMIVLLLVAQASIHRMGDTLTAQRQWVLNLLPMDIGSGDWIAINAVEFYVFTEQPSPWPVSEFFVDRDKFIAYRLPNGCQTLIDDLESGRFHHVFIRAPGTTNCLATIWHYLQEHTDQFESIDVIATR